MENNNLLNKISFPTLSNTKVHYFDYSATTFMPKRVMDKWIELNSNCGVFIGRGNSILTKRAESILKESEKIFHNLFGLSKNYSNIYTKNVTEAINILALSIEKEINILDMIVVGPFEHHSNYLPWKYLAKKTGALFCEIPTDSEGKIDYSYIEKNKDKIKILSVSAISNSFGYSIDVEKICNIIGNNTYFFVDESQVTGHMKMITNEKTSGYFIASHKMYGPKNIALAAIKKDVLNTLNPVILGGGMVENVGFQDSWLEERKKFMAGTMDVALIGAWAEACKFISEISYDEIRKRNEKYSKKIIETLQEYGYKHIFFENHSVDYIISFIHPSLHAHDVCEYLATKNIIIRSGNLCSQNALRKIGSNAINRISLGLGITDDDVELICKELGEMII